MLRRMNTMNWRLRLAGVLVAGALGLVAWKFAWATPGSGATTTPLAGPSVLLDVDTKSETDDHEIELKTKGLSDVHVSHIRIVPGGQSGWHSHPGPSIISVKAGTLTLYDDCDDFLVGHDFPTGTALVEDAECVHRVVNEGDTDLEIVVVQIVPLGAPRRIDEPAPAP